jgi:hypothetical protein
MEKDILSRVIGVEKEIQERLIAEKEKSVEWLEKVRREAEEEVAAAEVKLKESLEKEKICAVADAEREAAEILRRASEEEERISSISDEALRRVIMKYIALILPEAGI